MAGYEGLASVRNALSLPDGSARLEIKPEPRLKWQWAQVSPEQARVALAFALAAINGGWKLYVSLPDDPSSNLLAIGLSKTPDRPEAPVPTFIVQTGTALEETDQTFDFAVADWDGDGKPDLIVIKKSNTGSGSTEVHILKL